MKKLRKCQQNTLKRAKIFLKFYKIQKKYIWWQFKVSTVNNFNYNEIDFSQKLVAYNIFFFP